MPNGFKMFITVLSALYSPLEQQLIYLTIVFFCLALSHHLRLDKGSEMGSIATIHAFLRTSHPEIRNPEDGVKFGPSTSNKVKHI